MGKGRASKRANNNVFRGGLGPGKGGFRGNLCARLRVVSPFPKTPCRVAGRLRCNKKNYWMISLMRQDER